VVLEQPGIDGADRFVEDLELMPQPHLVDSQLVFLRYIRGDLLLQEGNGRIDALDVAHVLVILLLLALGHVHAGVEAGEALHDLRAGQQRDAFGVAIHDIFGEIGSVVLAEAEFVEHALPGGLFIFFIKHCGRI